MINKSQIGYIEVSYTLLEEFWYDNREVVPLNIEFQARCNSHRYLVYCKHFRVLKDGESIPTYKFIYSRDEKSGLCLLLRVEEVK